MYTILALICQLSLPTSECLPQTARDVYVLGKDLTIIQCQLFSQMTDGRVDIKLAADEYKKYKCVQQG